MREILQDFIRQVEATDMPSSLFVMAVVLNKVKIASFWFETGSNSTTALEGSFDTT